MRFLSCWGMFSILATGCGQVPSPGPREDDRVATLAVDDESRAEDAEEGVSTSDLLSPEPSPAAADSGQAAASDRGPPYPLVFVHGYLGFDDFAGVSAIPYFYRVQATLAKASELDVFTPALDPFNSSEVRGEQLASYVEDILSSTGKDKVNLIAHSQGGLDARVVANLHPEWVASIVTIGTPHGGSSAVDALLGLVDRPLLAPAIDELFRLFGRILYKKIDGRTSVMAALRTMSDEGSRAFNEAHPDEPGVFYASIAGVSSSRAGPVFRPGDVGACAADETLPFVEDFDQDRDLVNVFLSILAPWLSGEHDGLVPVTSARWGTFWGCIPADHFDEVGQFLGIATPGPGNPWDHLDFYVQLVDEVRARGF